MKKKKDGAAIGEASVGASDATGADPVQKPQAEANSVESGAGGADNSKVDVDKTLRELRLEQKNNDPKKRHPALTVLMIVFFPVTGLVLLLRTVFRRLNLPITVKMTIIETLIFALALVGFTVFFITSVKYELGGASKYLTTLTVTSVVLIVVVLVLFASLTAVSGQLMLKPVSKMISQIDDITGEDLSARLEAPDSQDELRELTNRINEMLSNLQESFDRQQNFVADASHELKTPIAVIQGYANLLKRWGKSKPEILDEGIEAIARESDNMKRMVEQLLLLARLGNLNMNKTHFDLVAAVREVVESYSLVASDHKLSFSGDAQLKVETDKNMLTECVRTLVDNAIKYTPSKGDIRVVCRMVNDHAEISVTDNGIGISQDDIQHIFERFYRCDKARVREKGGSGLGLSIAKSIVETMGGKIEVHSVVGAGTTFTIILY